MKTTILFGLGIFLLFRTQQAYGEQPEGRLARYGRLKYVYDGNIKYGRSYYEPPSTVRGKRGRKYARRFSYAGNLTGDKLAIYKEHGYTPHRLGYNVAGQRFERWKYYSEGMEFVFKGSDLVDTRRFMPESNHID